MIKVYLLFYLLFCGVYGNAQEKNSVSSGTITITTNQQMKFTNLRFVADQVLFISTETKSEFTYFMNSIRSIVESDGTTIFLKEGSKLPVERPVTEEEQIRKKYPPLMDRKQVYAKIDFKSGATLWTYIKASISIIEPERLNELSIDQKVTAINGKEKTRYDAADIKRIAFIDFRYNERIFVGFSNSLHELLFDGKIKWYRIYSQGSNYKIDHVDYMYNTELEESFFLGVFNNRRKKLKEMTVLQPDLVPYIEEMRIEDQTLSFLVRKYEKGTSGARD